MVANRPVVSVLMSVFNERLEFLRQAISSVLLQTCQDFEFIIIDDGSTDERTVGWLEARTATCPKIRLHRTANQGLTRTLNFGLSVALGEFICRQDSDDWSEPSRLARQVAFLEANPEIGVVGSDALIHQESGATLWRVRLPRTPFEVHEAFLHGNPFFHGATCFRRGLARDLGGYREQFRCSQDYDFFWRLCDSSAGFNLPEALYHYRYVGTGISATRSTEQVQVHAAARLLATARRLGAPENVETALREARRQLENGEGVPVPELKQADHAMLAGHYGGAFRSYVEFVRQHPANWKGWMKLARLGPFIGLPPARKRLFLPSIPKRNSPASADRVGLRAIPQTHV